VDVVSFVGGLSDNTPPEVFEAFVAASAQCLQCVDASNLKIEGDADVGDVSFKIDVCMDDVSPLDSSATYYTDYVTMLEDFQEELTACYAEKDAFYDSWSTLCADSGIDLSLSTRSTDRETVMYGLDDMDTQNSVVTSYSSDESHRSTSHMIFYAALGFVTVSAFAVFGTALVVRALNKKKEGEEAQAAQWVSELTSVETTNPASPGPV
jgi:hypothetical protein